MRWNDVGSTSHFGGIGADKIGSMDLRYPIGKFDFSARVAPEDRAALIDQIEAAPANLRAAVRGLTEEQLDTPYRPGGWTLRQVVHHVPDSHMNSFIRLRLALTGTNRPSSPTTRRSGRN